MIRENYFRDFEGFFGLLTDVFFGGFAGATSLRPILGALLTGPTLRFFASLLTGSDEAEVEGLTGLFEFLTASRDSTDCCNFTLKSRIVRTRGGSAGSPTDEELGITGN